MVDSKSASVDYSVDTEKLQGEVPWRGIGAGSGFRQYGARVQPTPLLKDCKNAKTL